MRTAIVAAIVAGLAVAAVGGATPELEQRWAPQRSGNSSAYQSRNGATATENFSRRLRLGSSGRVSLSNVSGAIVVSGASGDEVSIEATKRTRGARSLLDDVRIEVEERSGRINIRTVYPERGWRGEGVSVDYTLTIPAQAAIDVVSVSGSVKVSRVKGTISATTISGDVALSEAARIELAKAISGSIEIVDSTLEAETELSTVSGSMRLRDVNARDLQLKTVSGRFEATALSSDRLNIQSISGRVDFSGKLSRNGRYSFGSHSGSVRLALLQEAGFELDADTFSGSIRSDFPGRTVQASGGRSRSARSLEATVGDGSATVRVQTFSGSIVIERR